ncbi:MAG: Fic family protein [Jatrophihabitantaceae bacterium]
MTDGETPTPDAAHYEPFPPFTKWEETPFDQTTFARYKSLLEDTRAQADAETQQEALRIASRSAAVDTGAIEGLYDVDRGFTATIAAKTANWEQVIGARGESTKRAIEDAIAAYDLVLDGVTGSRGPITEVWIKQLHATICAHQDTYRVITSNGPQEQALPKGSYKQYPNSPINLKTGRLHAYAPPLDTPPEMARLIQEINSHAFLNAHPVVQAAYAHYAFVCIHPFADGNGRVARALASAYLYRDPGVPLVVFADQKGAYLDALEAADAGVIVPFLNFMSARAVEAVEMVRMEVGRIPIRKRREQILAEMKGSLESNIGMSHLEVDALGGRLLDDLNAELAKQIAATVVPAGIYFSLSLQTGDPGLQLPGYRPVLSSLRFILLAAASRPPAETQVYHRFVALVGQPGAPGAKFVLLGSHGDRLDLELEQVYPAVSSVTAWRIAAFAENSLTASLGELQILIDQRLRQAGYL